MGAFFHTLESQSPPSVDGVRMRWCLGLKGEFDTKSFYEVVLLFGQVAWAKILTDDHLRKRGFTIMDWCCLCRGSGESVDHL